MTTSHPHHQIPDGQTYSKSLKAHLSFPLIWGQGILGSSETSLMSFYSVCSLPFTLQDTNFRDTYPFPRGTLVGLGMESFLLSLLPHPALSLRNLRKHM